jgi:hypothetical protein
LQGDRELRHEVIAASRCPLTDHRSQSLQKHCDIEVWRAQASEVPGKPGQATVGMPVTRHPPCSPGRAVFPHPVPRLHSLPRRVIPCLLSPAGRLAHAVPVRRVRDEFPFRAACFRRVLPHVVGFPHLGVLRSIRLPNRIRWVFPVTVLLHLPVSWSPTVRRFQHCSVSGFPLPCLRSCRPYTVVFHGRNVWGLPSSSTSLFLHAMA